MLEGNAVESVGEVPGAFAPEQVASLRKGPAPARHLTVVTPAESVSIVKEFPQQW
jgi:hypothetical protein